MGLTDIFQKVETEVLSAVGLDNGVPSGAPASSSDFQTLDKKRLQLQSAVRQVTKSQPWTAALGQSADALLSDWQAKAANTKTAAGVSAALKDADSLLQKFSDAWANVAQKPTVRDYAAVPVEVASAVGRAGVTIEKYAEAAAGATPNLVKYGAIALAAVAVLYGMGMVDSFIPRGRRR